MDDMKIECTVGFGTVLAIEAFWGLIGLAKTFLDIAKANRLPECCECAVFAMTANRLCAPDSKLGVWERWIDTVCLPSCSELKLHHMYETMDLLHENIAEVQKTVFFRLGCKAYLSRL